MTRYRGKNLLRVRGQGSGFTIVELMIATVVFSVVLLIITAGLLSIGRSYYKGVSSVQAQEAANTIAQAIGQDIQFSGGSVLSRNGTYDMWCAGSRRYTYAPAKAQGATSSPLNVVVADSISGSCSGSTPIPNLNRPLTDAQYTKPQSLLGPKMRIVKFEVTPAAAANTYNISVRVVYGDDDLLCSDDPAAPPNDCSSGGVSASVTDDSLMKRLICKSIRSGTQFCAVSEINTTVVKRVK